MQISSNTTGMKAGLTVASDKEGRDYCVVVIKGTFVADRYDKLVLAQQQVPLFYVDVHYGDPAATSIKYECDFSRIKPQTDVIVIGHAYAPGTRPVDELDVALEAASIKKKIRIVGDRQWERGLIRLRSSAPVPFVKIPLTFERSFGGSDHSHIKPKYQGTELRNPVGIGFHKNSKHRQIKGTSLPNLEHHRYPIRRWSDNPPPVGFGVIGRSWQPRIRYAGTYNERWLNERFPFLPEDFDDRYFQSAPPDQQVPFLKRGEALRCTNMSPDGQLEFTVPREEVRVVFRFRDGDVKSDPKLDTLIIEPDQRRVVITWRTNVSLGRKFTNLREVLVKLLV